MVLHEYTADVSFDGQNELTHSFFLFSVFPGAINSSLYSFFIQVYINTFYVNLSLEEKKINIFVVLSLIPLQVLKLSLSSASCRRPDLSCVFGQAQNMTKEVQQVQSQIDLCHGADDPQPGQSDQHPLHLCTEVQRLQSASGQ